MTRWKKQRRCKRKKTERIKESMRQTEKEER
jgi:hypothetical protein